MKKIVFICLICSLFGLKANGTVKPNSLFTNNMVLQNGVEVPVWGTASENETVTVEFCSQHVTTVAKEGKWFVKLKPLKIGGPFEMTIKGNNVIKIGNVLVGEVWLCSGQSNMERKLGLRNFQKPILNWRNEVLDAYNYPQIRQYSMLAENKWEVCDSTTAKNFTAVGYFFAKALTQKLKVPIGLLFSAVGGAPAESWTSRAALENNPELSDIVQRYEKSIVDYPEALKRFNIQKDTLLQKWIVDSTKIVALGKPVCPWYKPAPPREPTKTGFCGGLFKTRIEPLIPYAIKVVIWYQGEQDHLKAKQYQTLFPVMIADWRSQWNIGNFPFLFVQIAPFNGIVPEIREAQLLTLKKTVNTAMVVTVDCGDSTDIHPNNKKLVGERLALAARAVAYTEKVVYSGPLYSSYKVMGNSIEISFEHVHKGLVAKGGELKDFVIAGADKKFVPAKDVIKGSKIIVSSNKVLQPIAVRMGWKNAPEVNLYNKNGLPASPFRTDVE